MKLFRAKGTFMKKLLILLIVSGGVFAAPPDKFSGTPLDYKDEKFQACVSPSCIYALCEKGEIVEKRDIVPLIGCNKAMRKNKNGKYVLDFYEVGIKEIAFKPKEAGGTEKKPVGILFRFR